MNTLQATSEGEIDMTEAQKYRRWLGEVRELLGSISIEEGALEKVRNAPRDFPGKPVACAYLTDDWMMRADAFMQATGED